jgi:hypothetical protein
MGWQHVYMQQAPACELMQGNMWPQRLMLINAYLKLVW